MRQYGNKHLRYAQWAISVGLALLMAILFVPQPMKLVADPLNSLNAWCGRLVYCPATVHADTLMSNIGLHTDCRCWKYL